MYQIDYQYIN